MKADTLNETVGVLTRREIEARILKPFFEAVSTELGQEKAEALLKDVVINEAKTIGANMKKAANDDGLESFAAQWEPWFRGGALEIDELERSDEAWRFNVTRCKYAELYASLGLRELGATLSCNRDAALIEGYSDDVVFERTQTLMEGAAFCNFHYRKKTRD